LLPPGDAGHQVEEGLCVGDAQPEQVALEGFTEIVANLLYAVDRLAEAPLVGAAAHLGEAVVLAILVVEDESSVLRWHLPGPKNWRRAGCWFGLCSGHTWQNIDPPQEL